MSAANQTWTLDVAGLKYIDRNGIEHTITTNETMRFDLTDLGTTGILVAAVGGGRVTCTDGFEFEPHADTRFQIGPLSDGANVVSGEVCFKEEGNVLNVFEVTAITISNADGVASNNVSSITMEQIADRTHTMTWTGINTA